MATARDVIQRALRLARVLGEGETMTAESADDALEALNQMLDSWNADRLYVYNVKLENFNLVAGTNSYTIGDGGTFSTTRPVAIDGAFIRRNNLDYHVDVVAWHEYDRWVYKGAQSSLPFVLAYEPSYPLATIRMYPTPVEALTLYLRTRNTYSSVTLDTVFSVPPGYLRAMAYTLAEEIAPEYGTAVLPDVTKRARTARKAIQRLNSPDYILDAPLGARRVYNVYSDH